MRRYTETINEHTKYPDVVPVKGLVLVHLFNKVWRIGGIKMVDGKRHSIIYSPDDKEFHVWEKDVLSFYSNQNDPDGHFFNKPDPAKVKIYILTHILDEIGDWSFDMTKTPEIGSNVKVIFQNGTIKWIENFSGDWKNHWMAIPSQIPIGLNPEWEKSLGKTIRDKNGKIKDQPSQFNWVPSTDYKKIVAWRKN